MKARARISHCRGRRGVLGRKECAQHECGWKKNDDYGLNCPGHESWFGRLLQRDNLAFKGAAG
jgi:hypothetical protein